MSVKFAAHKIQLIFKEKLRIAFRKINRVHTRFIIRRFEDLVVILILSTARILTGIPEIPIVCL